MPPHPLLARLGIELPMPAAELVKVLAAELEAE